MHHKFSSLQRFTISKLQTNPRFFVTAVRLLDLNLPITLTKITAFKSSRSFFSSTAVNKQEQGFLAAGDEINSQREILKQLYNNGNYKQCITRFENQPKHFQFNNLLLEIYIAALIMDGKSNQVVERISPLIHRNEGSLGGASTKRNDALFLRNPLKNSSHTSYDIRTDPSVWQNAIDKNQPSAAYSSRNGGLNPLSSQQQPIIVSVKEMWSWAKFFRDITIPVVLCFFLITGIAVAVDSQGALKGGQPGAEPLNSKTTVKFDDVQGVDEAKHELEEVVEFLKNPAKFTELGGKLPKGILLYGPPGTGKTLLARAVAGEAGVPFFQVSGSEFDELYVGVGAKRVRELFASAKKHAPCIIFIDELDAVGSKRSTKDQNYMRQTLNQLLVEMDGFSPSSGVILIGATNTPDSLDKALVRPGRFDRLVPVTLPDVRGRKQILQVHMKGVTFSPDVEPEIIARGTPGFSGADLANLVNQAAINASSNSLKAVTMANLEWAKDKILMGSVRKSAVISPESKKCTAYHEGGHTLVALYTDGATPLHKVTVLPRGRALGVTLMLPEADRTSITKKELTAQLDVAMGGRVAEELIYGVDNITTGASNDLQQATKVAREMVLFYGMSDKIGLISWSSSEFAGASTETKTLIEQEVKTMLEMSYQRVRTLLIEKSGELHKLAAALIEQETLDVKEVKKLINMSESIKTKS